MDSIDFGCHQSFFEAKVRDVPRKNGKHKKPR
jgi:hypothetical protein